MIEIKAQEKKKTYAVVEIEARLFSHADVITASQDDPEKDNDQVQGDGIFD